MSGYTMLRAMGDRTAALAICDPQYRAVLDKLGYGNEGARQKGRASLPQMTDRSIALIIEQIERVLRPSGHLALWVDKYAVGTGHHLRYLTYAPELAIVDVLHWDKGRPGMGYRSRIRSEYCIVIQKPPVRAKGIWTDHGFEDSFMEYADRSLHPHAKPLAATERLIRAVTKRGDLVVDPCAGGYGVLEACRRSGREFMGCDVVG
jgi:site-specific DNA-methyltransferase (adenine-specific)